MNRNIPKTLDCFKAISNPEIYRNFMIHLFVMFPAAMMMCWLASLLDQKLGWSVFGADIWRIPSGLSLIFLGGIWVWFVYGYLFLVGEGSPGTHVDGGPIRLVDTGPYSAMRHPSVLGKLLGVTGLGLAWGSTSFLLFFLPILLLYSYATNRLIQEKFCYERFGNSYAQYSREVPMFLPNMKGFRRWKNKESVLAEVELASVSSQPPGIWNEFRWYLLGLIGLLSLFGFFLWIA